MSSLLPLLAGLLGTLLGGTIAYLNGVAQWKRQQSASRKQLLSAKLEAACELVIDIHIGLSATWAETILRINGFPPTNDEEKNTKRIPLEHLEMLTLLYFSTLAPHAKAVIQARNQLGKVLAKSITTPPSNTNERDESLSEGAAAYKQVEKSCQDFLADAARIAKELI